MCNQAFRDSIQKKICQNFCAYFKSSKNEDLACMGFLVVEKLLKKGKKIPFDKIRRKLDSTIEEKLISAMCIACSFYENDCDFVMKYRNKKNITSNPPQSPFRKGGIYQDMLFKDEGLPKSPPLVKGGEGGLHDEKESPPCGGFLLLGYLLEKNIISIDDIKNII